MSSEDCEINPQFSVRLVVADHYMARPIPGIDVVYSDFRGSDIKQVPVLRLFGPTPDGYKTCVHVHGVFPYFYIPCGATNPEPQLLYQIAASIDKALNISLKQANSTNQHVYRISLVKGLPFYGFHYKEHLFFKIFLYNPSLVKQTVDLLNNGAILAQVFQPYEAHLNFTLQFFIDFNLFGMSNVDFQSVKFRKRGDTSVKSSGDFFDELDVAKPESMCYYEVDVSASHIINRQRIGKGDGIENPGLEEVWNDEKERRKQLNISMASKSLTQVRDNNQTESHVKFQNMFLSKFSNLTDNKTELPSSKEQIYYPAESLERSQLYNASDVSIHLPCDSILGQSTESLKSNFNETIVDENVALDCSLVEYDHVTLDSQDLNFIELLKDMDDVPVDVDSVLGTQVDQNDNSDDLEYSQVFDDEDMMKLMSMKIDSEKEDPSSSNIEESDRKTWEDSFWDGVNIPQLDGTCDDENTKKVKKRKRSIQVGLRRPKKQIEAQTLQDKSFLMDTINAKQISDTTLSCVVKAKVNCQNLEVSVEKNETAAVIYKHENESDKCTELDNCKLYDMQNNCHPIAGPSNLINQMELNKDKKRYYVSLKQLKCSSSSNSTLEGENTRLSPNKLCSDSDCELDDTLTLDCKAFSTVRDNNETTSNHCNESTDLKLQTSSSTINSFPTKLPSSLSSEKKIILSPKFTSPTRKDIMSFLHTYKIPEHNNLMPYYSNYKDVGNKIEVGAIVLKLSSNAVHHQKLYNIEGVTGIEDWRKNIFMEQSDMSQDIPDISSLKCLLAGNTKCILEPIAKPPNRKCVQEWIRDRNYDDSVEMESSDKVEITKILDDLDNSQAIGLETDEFENSLSLEKCSNTMKSSLNQSLQISMQPDGSFLCFGGSSNQNESQAIDAPTVENDFLTIMMLEIHTEVRGDLNPDPKFDAMLAVFLSVSNDSPHGNFLPRNYKEIYVVSDPTIRPFERCGLPMKVNYVNNEQSLIEKVTEEIRKWDPDILCGYEIELSSWGYLLERCEALGLDLVPEISRITEKNRQKKWKSDNHNYEGKILGRVMLNVWRMLRHELALSSYSFENAMFHIMKERVPSYSPATLCSWWKHESSLLRWIPFEYYLTKLTGTMKMLEKLDMINRTSELARLFGLQWWEVLSRGSQFRVESLMLRAARPLNLVALSPSVRQRAKMRAPECLPLIFEPESRFYADPVIVLDFQSLYPSIMIAYNYCFSTCIGRIQNINGDSSYEFGAWRLRIPGAKLKTLAERDLISWSPVGAGFVKPEVRRGVLPALLRRILAARQAVKKTMKMQTDEGVKRAMHSRQLGLKLIANVTYGYTAAHFSGRMPCVEVGDSVVAKGRETLERAIRLVEANQQWNVKVVYGDTDSMFVLVPGATRERAFLVGQEIADAVTADNPAPVALKLEKVYQPCILQTKKRYVGHMYESADQTKPVYEAKGIETVRRDGCPAGVKLLQRSLCELFECGDMSRVRALVTRALARLMDGRTPLHELLFTREYHGPGGYRPGGFAPPLEIVRRLSSRDARAAPPPGWRVSWCVAAGVPGVPLVRLARAPGELLADASLRPHASYYAMRVLLPPLHRCLSLLGADVFAWYRGMCVSVCAGVGGIAQYMRRACAACGGRGGGRGALCAGCARDPARAYPRVAVKRVAVQVAARDTRLMCASCCGHSSVDGCNNWECPVLWRRQTAQLQLRDINNIEQTLPKNFRDIDF